MQLLKPVIFSEPTRRTIDDHCSMTALSSNPASATSLNNT